MLLLLLLLPLLRSLTAAACSCSSCHIADFPLACPFIARRCRTHCWVPPPPPAKPSFSRGCLRNLLSLLSLLSLSVVCSPNKSHRLPNPTPSAAAFSAAQPSVPDRVEISPPRSLSHRDAVLAASSASTARRPPLLPRHGPANPVREHRQHGRARGARPPARLWQLLARRAADHGASRLADPPVGLASRLAVSPLSVWLKARLLTKSLPSGQTAHRLLLLAARYHHRVDVSAGFVQRPPGLPRRQLGRAGLLGHVHGSEPPFPLRQGRAHPVVTSLTVARCRIRNRARAHERRLRPLQNAHSLMDCLLRLLGAVRLRHHHDAAVRAPSPPFCARCGCRLRSYTAICSPQGKRLTTRQTSGLASYSAPSRASAVPGSTA